MVQAHSNESLANMQLKYARLQKAQILCIHVIAKSYLMDMEVLRVCDRTIFSGCNEPGSNRGLTEVIQMAESEGIR